MPYSSDCPICHAKEQYQHEINHDYITKPHKIGDLQHASEYLKEATINDIANFRYNRYLCSECGFVYDKLSLEAFSAYNEVLEDEFLGE